MKFGYCVNMIARDPEGIGLDWIPQLKANGFDYVELPLAQMMALDDKEFESGPLRALEQSGLRCMSCNNFFPGSCRLTGPQPDPALDYAGRALQRAARLGAERVVFGSSGARNVPLGFPRDAALDQIVELLIRLGDMASQHGITIVIEPLNISESNVINSFEQGVELARRAAHPHVAMLVDSYHLRMQQEPDEHLLQGADLLRHVHLARPLGRSLPHALDEEDYEAFFRRLRQIGYDGAVSIEAYLKPGEGMADVAEALRYLRRISNEGM